ncbi:MAG TPA: TonB-dependent receptor plug domain-containing protein [Chthoniobacterales bacterium]|nr:TonB-dependent receptor plug domain-containing protein [Chthoniobacterales bacterium]
MRIRPLCFVLISITGAAIFAHAEDSTSISPNGDQVPEAEPVVVSATRFEIPLDRSPASVSVIDSQEFEEKQTERVADALRAVPGLSVVQTGTQGQLTSVFMRGLPSEDMQVLLDGIPINQGLSGAMNFADITIDDIDRVEVVRGPQSTLYGPRALAGAIQLFTAQGSGRPGLTVTSEGGSYGTFRESISSSGKIDLFDYSIGASRIDTDNARPNNQYRNTAITSDLGLAPADGLQLGTLVLYSLSDAGNPNSIFTPRSLDNLLTERWLIGPHLDWKPNDWWEQRIIFDYDHERQLNDPNQDGFTGPTRALFRRTQLDYQNDIRPTSWLTITDGFFFSHVLADQERPFVLFGPKFISDEMEDIGGFLQGTVDLYNFILVAGGRVDWFNHIGNVWTYRVAGSYKIDKTDTTLHASVATGFSPPSSQDKIFGNNFNLQPEKDFGWDAGVEQRLWDRRITVGATYFHNDLSNVIGFNGQFKTLNLGAAETQGVETELRATPVTNLTMRASYTYLEAEKTDNANIAQPQGSRLPRRPRNEVYLSGSYLWWNKLRTTVEAKFVNAREELSFGAPNFDIEDYSFLNIAAEYEINSYFSIYGRVDNVTGEHYAEVFGFPALGTAAYGGMKVRF